jgi:hypothetical protein
MLPRQVARSGLLLLALPAMIAIAAAPMTDQVVSPAKKTTETHSDAKSTPSEKVEPEEAGYVALFNGKDLAGWIGDTTGYLVEEGAIVCGKDGRNLYTADEYANFSFRFEFKLAAGANNGIGIRTPTEGDAAYAGMEVQVLDNTAEQYKSLKEYQFHGSVYGIAAAKREFLKPVGEWNSEEIIADGRTVKVILNGETIVDVNLDEVTKSGTLDGKDHPGLKNEKGHIGFCGHGDRVSFRNLRVKTL